VKCHPEIASLRSQWHFFCHCEGARRVYEAIQVFLCTESDLVKAYHIRAVIIRLLHFVRNDIKMDRRRGRGDRPAGVWPLRPDRWGNPHRGGKRQLILSLRVPEGRSNLNITLYWVSSASCLSHVKCYPEIASLRSQWHFFCHCEGARRAYEAIQVFLCTESDLVKAYHIRAVIIGLLHFVRNDIKMDRRRGRGDRPAGVSALRPDRWGNPHRGGKRQINLSPVPARGLRVPEGRSNPNISLYWAYLLCAYLTCTATIRLPHSCSPGGLHPFAMTEDSSLRTPAGGEAI